jgi:hypothetical protein
MDLRETTKLMESEDYKERFKGEYAQTKIRFTKLDTAIQKLDANTLGYDPKSGYDLMVAQAQAMANYLKVLKTIAMVEDIDLEEVE